jgi:hypothetical protein
MPADLVVEPRVPEICGEVVAATAVVVMVNVAEVPPAGTVTEDGGTAEGSLELRATILPPAGALPLRNTVPVVLVPPITVLGDTVR